MPGAGGQLSELFLSIEDFWGRAPELADALGALDDLVTPLATQAYYSPNEDRALLALVLDPRNTGRSAVSKVARMLFALRVDCFELEALSSPERDHFHTVELPRYTKRVKAADGASAAVSELYRVAGGTDQAAGDWAQGTPAEAQRVSVGEYSQVRRRPTSKPVTTSRAHSRDFLIRGHADITADLEGTGSWATDDPTDGSRRIARGSDNAESVSALGSGNVATVADDEAQPQSDLVLGAQLRVRFLRGERWLAGRARYVSNREIRIATGAPLRLGDSAIVGISFEDDELFVSGTVSAVDAIDSEPVKSPGFSVAFGTLEPAKADRLVELLRKARDAGVSLTPPPVRGAPRFPVSWPVVVRTDAAAQRAIALDVSWSGVYLDIKAEVGSDILFAIPLDNAGDSIRCRGTVVRTVTSTQAEAFQTVAGCGITITHFGSGDADRYRAFLERVKSRCQRRVVVAAAPLRAQGLTKALAAAGYAVTSSTDPNALAELADREARPPDIAVIDESLAGAMEGEMLRAMFRRRNVPCLATTEEASDRTRRQVDRMLSVEAA